MKKLTTETMNYLQASGKFISMHYTSKLGLSVLEPENLNKKI